MPKDRLRDDKSEFADWLYSERKRRRETQDTFGKGIGAEKGMVSHWERGHHIPSAKYIYAISRYWNVDEDWLLSKAGYRSITTPRDEPSSALANLIHLLEEVELNDERTAHLVFLLENMKRADTAANTTEPAQLALAASLPPASHQE